MGGEPLGKPHTHSWSSTLSHDRTNHYFECSGCDEVKDSQEHDFETLGNGTCCICAFYLDHDCSNFIGTKYGYDAENHYFKCTYCKENVLSTAQAHQFNRDTCTICDYVDPNYVASSAPTVSKMYDLRVIVREFYTLIVFPDGKIALIDPNINDSCDLRQMIPYDHDEDNDGLREIDYLIFTNTGYIPTYRQAFTGLEVINLYRPNLGFNPEEVLMSDYESYSYYGEKFTNENLADVPEYLTTGVNLPYYDCVVETEKVPPYYRLNYEGRYNVSSLYIAALYYADLNGVNVIPIKPENSIHNTFSYLGREYSYSLDFLDLGIEFNVPDSAFSKMLKNGYFSSEDVYIDDTLNYFDQYVEYSSMFTVSYNGFEMLYMCEASKRAIETFNTKYKNLYVDLFVFSYSALFEIGKANVVNPFVYLGEAFVGNVFDKTKNDTNVLFVNPYYWGDLTTAFFENKFIYEDYQTIPAIKRDNYTRAYVSDTSSAKTNIITACYRVNKLGEKSVERWTYFSDNQMASQWDDWN